MLKWVQTNYIIIFAETYNYLKKYFDNWKTAWCQNDNQYNNTTYQFV